MFKSSSVVKAFKDWTVRRTTGSQRATCGRHRPVNVRAEQTCERQQNGNSAAICSRYNISERTVRRTMHVWDMEVEQEKTSRHESMDAKCKATVLLAVGGNVMV